MFSIKSNLSKKKIFNNQCQVNLTLFNVLKDAEENSIEKLWKNMLKLVSWFSWVKENNSTLKLKDSSINNRQQLSNSKRTNKRRTNLKEPKGLKKLLTTGKQQVKISELKLKQSRSKLLMNRKKKTELKKKKRWRFTLVNTVKNLLPKSFLRSTYRYVLKRRKSTVRKHSRRSDSEASILL